ncbi:LexA family transcriptional regulator [Methylosinus sp. Sm6]|uniref:S24 family peptidase n=1 Tax=Methylosinus sp. Sm6 TaxID=2866948 RepID=UPI001C992EF5|nr:LexA family transcriptional regulator [Methylosinus sp. Sm6]MBY6243512.1 helix-turn-helix domain-containing protein [Methylosinus sp. Sm6]
MCGEIVGLSGDVDGGSVAPGFAERLGQAIDAAGGVRVAMKVTGISDSQLRRYIGGDSEPSISKLCAIAGFAGVSLRWLVYGQGAVLSDDQIRGNVLASDDTIQVPILDIRAAAGAGSINGDAAELGRAPFSRAFFRHHGVSPEAAQLIRSCGVSMVPTIADRALVMVDRLGRDVVDGDIYVVSLGDEVRIKRLHKSISGKITLKSDNGDKRLFPDEELSVADSRDLRVHGRAFWTERAL